MSMKMMYICKQCGKEFTPKSSAGKKFYCSTSCYHKSTKKGKTKICPQCGKSFYRWRGRSFEKYCSLACRKKANQINKICPVCEKSFSVPKSQTDRYIVCSWECRTKFTLYKICHKCGKVFNDTSKKRNDRKHCSEECRRPPIYTKCLHCQKSFRISPSAKGIKRFCSFSCYRKYSGETTIETIVKESLKRMKINFIQEYQIPDIAKRICVDFFLPMVNICLEVDGKYWHSNPLKDIKKDKSLKKLGYGIVRIKELDITNADNIDNLVLTSLKLVTYD